MRWLPLESNPEVMNKFLREVGVPTTSTVSDVYGLDEELLTMVPKPVHALMLLYPITTKSEDFKQAQETSVESDGQELSSNVYFMKQYVSNACGTVALMHTVANVAEKIGLKDGILKAFFDKTKDMTPEERGLALEGEDVISNVHEECAEGGQTEAPSLDQKLDTHFIAFVNVDGQIYELDGRKKFPINHGATTDDTFLQDGAKVLRGFMERDAEEARFAVLALTATQ